MTDEYLAEFLSLPAIQRDFLTLLAIAGPQYGLALKDQLEVRRRTTVSSGRLYSNLDKLAAEGYIEKGKFTDRRNRYEITDHGERILQGYHSWFPGNDDPIEKATSPRPLQRLAILDAPEENDG